jgi:HEAT repeat protein
MPLIRKPSAGSIEEQPRSTAEATAALFDGNAQERWSAARRLATQPDAAPLLGKALRSENDGRVREAIFTSLVRLGNPESVEVAILHLRSDDADLRTGALDALRAMIASVRPRLPALLTDPDADIRVLCCDLVRELSAADATSLLSVVLERDPEPNVCAAAVDVLAEIGEATALPFLDDCAARFPDQRFLQFAVKAARERIIAQRAHSRE